MSNELKKIVKEIQFKTGKTLDVIASDIGYARAYFTNQVNVGTNKRLKELLLEKYTLEIEHNVPPRKHADVVVPDQKGSILVIEAKSLTASYEKLIESNERFIAEKEARRIEAVQRAELAEKEKDRLLSIIEQNLTALQINSAATLKQLSKVIRVMRADDGELMDGQDRIQGIAVGTTATRAGTVELAHERAVNKAHTKDDQGKTDKTSKRSKA